MAVRETLSRAGKMPNMLVVAAAVPFVVGVLSLLYFLLQLNRRKVRASES